MLMDGIRDGFVLPDVVRMSDDGLHLYILDQTLLPAKEVFVEINSIEEMADAISRLAVRGAPAIGVSAACALAVFFKRESLSGALDGKDPLGFFLQSAEVLKASRPTAVNLAWAADRMCSVFRKAIAEGASAASLADRMVKEAAAIKDEDIRMCLSIGRNGFTLMHRGCSVLTHCNAGHLAVSRFGTALSPIYVAQSEGYAPRVYADETRPLLQGARLTAYELMKAGVDVTLICDNMAASLMDKGMVDMVMVGCDRIAANGDFANKIGTCGVAVLAKHFGVPFYVLGPSSTFDPHTATGRDIVVEMRPPQEVTHMHYTEPKAPEGVKVYNPAFDVTPASLVTAYVNEYGVFRTPEGLAESVMKNRNIILK